MDLFKAAGVVAEKHPKVQQPDAYRDTEFDPEEMAYFSQAPVGELAVLYYDFLECDDDMGRRSRRTRQLRRIIKERRISDPELGAALDQYRRETMFSN